MSEQGVAGAFDAVAASTRLTGSVTKVLGVRGLAPGLRDLVATATARVMRRSGGEPVSVEVRRTAEGVHVRVNAHLDDSRPVADIIDELFAVIEVDTLAGTDEPVGGIDIDLRVVSRETARGETAQW